MEFIIAVRDFPCQPLSSASKAPSATVTGATVNAVTMRDMKFVATRAPQGKPATIVGSMVRVATGILTRPAVAHA